MMPRGITGLEMVNTYTKRFIYTAAPLSKFEQLVLMSRDSPLMTSALLLPNVRRHLICDDFNIKNNKLPVYVTQLILRTIMYDLFSLLYLLVTYTSTTCESLK
jgi:hypothetical protein